MNIGMSEAERGDVVGHLSKLLADSYTLYLKTHNFHWNVTGPQFTTLHSMFEQQYLELATAVDAIAERIRALGIKAPGSYREFAKQTTIVESSGGESATGMIRDLMEDQESIARTARSAFPSAADVHDEATADLLTQRIQLHESTAWMLRSLLDE